MRQLWHRKLSGFLRPGGRIILQGFSKNQINYNSGGPKDESMLFSIREIKNDFFDLIIMKLTSEIVQLNEGEYHNGEAAVINAVFQKERIT